MFIEEPIFFEQEDKPTEKTYKACKLLAGSS